MGANKSKQELIQTEREYFAVGETETEAIKQLLIIVRNETGNGKMKTNKETKEKYISLFKVKYRIRTMKVANTKLIKASITVRFKKEWCPK